MSLVKTMTEPEYRQYSAISYSMLSGVSKSPASLIASDKESTSGLIYGSAVDTYVFDGEEEFKKKFALNIGVSPSQIVEKITKDTMTAIIQTKGQLEGELDDYDNLILDIATALEYGKGWKPETIIRKVKDEGGKDLFSFTKENEGKKILDQFQYDNVINTANTLYTHEFSKKWLTANENEEVVFQFPIIWKYKGRECKSLFDIIKIDHVNKVIYPVDLKTSYDHVLSFPVNYFKWNYVLQASFYTDALKYFKLQHKELFDYRIDNFRFLVISSQDPFRPLVYKTTEVDIYTGKYGGRLKHKGYDIKGFDILINDMEWHLENQMFDYPREIYDSKGEIEFDVFER
jgi:hypothetical protein